MTPPPLSSVLVSVSALATDDLQAFWGIDPLDLEAALFGLLPGVLDTWAEAAAAAAADWYDELREAAEVAGQFSAIVEPLGDLGAYELAGWAAKPLDGPEPDVVAVRSRLEGGFQKRLANAANLTVTGSAKVDPQARGYMRRTRAGACKFCVMVASRGAVYTEQSSRFACHEHCFCEAVPAWGGRALPVREYKPSDRPQTDADRARVRRWIAENLDGPEPAGSPSRAPKAPAKPAETAQDIARRHLPTLERTLADLRKQGLPESAPQIQYHLAQIAKQRRNLAR